MQDANFFSPVTFRKKRLQRCQQLRRLLAALCQLLERTQICPIVVRDVRHCVFAINGHSVLLQHIKRSLAQYASIHERGGRA
jgi:hypothetical protein